jgi:hypothetical protein
MKIIFTAILLFVLASVAVLPSSSARRSAVIKDNLQWGQANDGIQMSLSSNDPKSSELQITLRNTGSRDVMLNLGSMLANGKVQLPDQIAMMFTDGSGRTRLFTFADKKHSSVGGRVDDYIVPLRVNSMYTLTVMLDQFWCQETNEFQIPLTGGSNRLTAEYQGTGALHLNLDTPGIKLMKFWLGKVESNTLILER